MTSVQAADVKRAIVEHFVNNAGVAADRLASGDVLIQSLDIDSLGMIEMLWVVEEQYGVRIDDLKALDGITLDGLAEHIRALMPDTGMQETAAVAS